MKTIEEAASELDEAMRLVRSLPPWAKEPAISRVLGEYQAKKRALALAAAAATACDCDGSHESNCPWLEQGVRVRAVCAQIERLGRAPAQEADMETTSEERAAWLAWVNRGRPNNLTREAAARLCRDVDTLVEMLRRAALGQEPHIRSFHDPLCGECLGCQARAILKVPTS